MWTSHLDMMMMMILQSLLMSCRYGISISTYSPYSRQSYPYMGMVQIHKLRSGNGGIGRSLIPENLEFIISDKQVEGYFSRVAELCKPVWKIQSAALEKLYTEQGI
ncbi:uncharacterized protein BT62DRAFT_545480 [Guyanagaster necrorhizus]|uniref:Uncharacterized protein n=1 Tax=Guyanagaster necrorhizus TaxID=856835 RepID=A0A9P8AMZ2_9AGAR|nr:uncharacterized protein BT62DRAFT_545480 [Guyanagaster necrorhizus MCA 3950]KAG7441216.1 hypothetical protein BT62DRAFT_545480 [Guyanagaster necrorhizus MCA 3950]